MLEGPQQAAAGSRQRASPTARREGSLNVVAAGNWTTGLDSARDRRLVAGRHVGAFERDDVTGGVYMPSMMRTLAVSRIAATEGADPPRAAGADV